MQGRFSVGSEVPAGLGGKAPPQQSVLEVGALGREQPKLEAVIFLPWGHPQRGSPRDLLGNAHRPLSGAFAWPTPARCQNYGFQYLSPPLRPEC